MSLRHLSAAICLVVIVALRAQPQLLRLPFGGRSALTRAFTGLADRRWPQFPRFLDGVRAHTNDGDTIALVVPVGEANSGYTYAFYRASYFLPGRIVLPLVDPRNVPHPENLRSARYVAVFGVPPPRGYRIVWSGCNGALLMPVAVPPASLLQTSAGWPRSAMVRPVAAAVAE